MSKIDDIRQQNSEEVKDILERMPTHFGKVITAIVAFLTFLIILFGNIVKYPDIVSGPISITYSNNPVKLVSKTSGVLELSDSTRLNYHEGEYIAWVSNAALTSDVQMIKEMMIKKTPDRFAETNDVISVLPKEVSLGEINQSYHTFRKLLNQYQVLIRREVYNDEITNLTNQISVMEIQLSNAQIAKDLRQKIVESQRKNFQKDSFLFAGFSNKAITEMDFEKSKIEYFNVLESYQNSLREITNLQIQIASTRSGLNQLKLSQMEKEQDSSIDLYSAYNSLLDGIKAWEERYVFISPFEGSVEYLKFWSQGQFIDSGEEFCTVIPSGSEMTGQMYLPSTGSGKVEKGQDVIIKLDNYPYLEYGTIKGIVKNISQITNTISLNNAGSIDTYRVEVMITDNGTTNYGVILDLNAEVKGVAEIITRQRVLFERLFDNLKYVLHQ